MYPMDAHLQINFEDGRDGAGVVSGADAVAFARGHTITWENNEPVAHGLATATMYPSDFSTGDIQYYVNIPNPKPSGQHLRVVLTWDSNPVFATNDNWLSDLDLRVNHNSGSNASVSYNDNIEIVDVDSGLLTAGATYEIRIHKWANKIPTSEGPGFFYYAIGWTWVKDHAE